MTSNNSNNNEPSFSVSLPIGTAVAGVLLVLAAGVAYLLLGNNGGTGETASETAKGGRSIFRRVGIMGLITLIENDATRKVVVAILKAMARRA